MFRCAFRPFSPFPRTSIASTARYFHRVTTDFIAHDVRGTLVTRKVPIIVGDPGETYVLIEPGVGNALRAASPFTSASAASAEDRCKLTFFHDSQHFGFGKIIELSPPLRPKPNASPNRVKYKPCNFILKRKDARDSPEMRLSMVYNPLTNTSRRTDADS
ncbi:hypothetical protein N7470_000802 [Penicillium chermesinum]|nr:hypothetical protein N7470_000802 [Penicillium chermesinum]